MADEATVISTEEQQEEAAFEAGFNATDIEPVAEEPTPEEKKEEVTPTEKKEEVKVDPPKPITAEDVNNAVNAAVATLESRHKAELQRLNDKVFGTVGELKQRIESIKGVAHELSPKAKERLNANFPELAAMLFDETPTPEPEKKVEVPAPVVDVDKVVKETVDNTAKSFERKLLSRDHKDWEQVVTSSEFAAWKSTQLTPEESTELDDTWDADLVSERITEFKNWQAEQAKAAEAARLKAEEEKKNQEKLEAAITPRGNPRTVTAKDEDDEESAMVKYYKPR